MAQRSRLLPLWVVVALGCGAPPSEMEGERPPEITLYGARLKNFRGSEVLYSGRAAKLTYERGSFNFQATEALVRFPSRSQQAASVAAGGLELRAPLLSGNLDTKQGVGEGGVVLRSNSGVTSRTDQVMLDGVRNLAWGESPISVKGPGYVVNAEGFDFDIASERFVFKEKVRSRVGGATP